MIIFDTPQLHLWDRLSRSLPPVHCIILMSAARYDPFPRLQLPLWTPIILSHKHWKCLQQEVTPMHTHEERSPVSITGYVWLFVYSIFPQANFLACTSLTHSLTHVLNYLSQYCNSFITYTIRMPQPYLLMPRNQLCFISNCDHISLSHSLSPFRLPLFCG